MKLPWDNQRENGAAPPGALAADSDERSLAHLQPGDAVSLWGAGDRLVTCVFDCAEGLGERSYSWSWIFLDDESLLEQSGDGRWRYADHQLVPQGSALFSDLVGPGGLLEQFEARVRDDTVGDDPVFVELRGRRYRVTSTGTVLVKRRGPPPQGTTLAPWAQFVASPDKNVYFSLVAADDEEQGVLGVWTSHVCLSFGRPLTDTDLDAVYRRAPR